MGRERVKKINNIDIIAIVALITSIISLALGIYSQWRIEHLPSSDDYVMEGNKYFEDGEYGKAVRCYEEALKIHEADADTWGRKGFAPFNLGINNKSVSISFDRPPYSYAKELIDYSLPYQPPLTSQDYLKRSLESFKKAVYHDPKDFEAWLYIGIVCLYLFPSPNCNAVEEFNETIARIDEEFVPYPLSDIESYAWHGKCTAYLKMGEDEKASECFAQANETK